jgi:formylglycine-generating enzyme required for sulfatase activity
LVDADPRPYAALFPVAQQLESETVTLFRAEIAKKATVLDGRQDLETVKDQLAERQTRAAIALLRMGKAEEVMPFLRHSADPRLRSFIVNWLKPLGTDPKILAAELARLDPPTIDKGLDSPATHHPSPGWIHPPPASQRMDAILFHPETSQRRALILAMGTYGEDELSPGEREPLIAKLLDLYRNDPDSGIHGSVEWALRKWGQGEQLKLADAELSKLKGRGDRRWYVNSQGQTFAVIEGPVEFLAGSPATETDRESDEIPHKVTIPRRFAIASKEVTVEQYRPFARTNPRVYGVKDESLKRYSPDPDGPMISFSWYTAAACCDWLSKQEGIPKDQWCYQRNSAGFYGPGMTVPEDVLRRTGYRLPTEAEWEYACRAGAVTSRYYGRSPDLLDRYAWYNLNSRERVWTGGSLLPSDLGGFDMLGSLFEWTQDRHEPYQKASAETIDESIDVGKSIKAEPHVLRGLTIINSAFNVRSACRS